MSPSPPPRGIATERGFTVSGNLSLSFLPTEKFSNYSWFSDSFIYQFEHSRELNSGGFRNYGARGQNHLRAPCLKIFCCSSSSFSLELLCLKGVFLFKCFPVISFQFFLSCGAPLWVTKVRGLGPWPPGPP